MVNPFLHLTDAQKQTKLKKLSEAYADLAAGAFVVKIDDEGRTGVQYSKADLPRLESMIWQLQNCLGLITPANNPRRAVAIAFR